MNLEGVFYVAREMKWDETTNIPTKQLNPPTNTPT